MTRPLLATNADGDMVLTGKAAETIEIVNPDRLVFRCKACGEGWAVDIRTGGKLRRGWWHCPRGCNTPS